MIKSINLWIEGDFFVCNCSTNPIKLVNLRMSQSKRVFKDPLGRQESIAAKNNGFDVRFSGSNPSFPMDSYVFVLIDEMKGRIETSYLEFCRHFQN